MEKEGGYKDTGLAKELLITDNCIRGLSLVMLQWMATHPRIYWQHKSDLVDIYENKREKTQSWASREGKGYRSEKS